MAKSWCRVPSAGARGDRPATSSPPSALSVHCTAAVARVVVERGDAPVVGLRRLHGEQLVVVHVCELGADVDERRQRGPVAVPAESVAARVGERRGAGRARRRAARARPPGRRAIAAQPEQHRGREPVRRAPACCDTSQLRRWSSTRDVLREQERAGGDAEAATVSGLRVDGAERRRPDEEHERGRDRGERGVAPEREPVGERGHRTTPRAPRAGWRRR